MVSTVATLSLALLFAARAQASCAYGTRLHPRKEGTVEVSEFGYVGLKGPLNWMALDPVANYLCANGTNQSPIDMVEGQFTLVPAKTLNITIPDMTEGAEFENLGTTVEVIARGGTMSVDNTELDLQQCHFHLPSEHLEDGVSHAMEMHMVWESEAGDVAVIGVYIDVEGTLDNREESKEPTESVVEETPAATESYASKTKADTMAQPDATATAGGKRSVRMVARDGRPQDPEAKPMKSAKTKRAATTFLETLFSSVGDIAKPGTATTTKPLVLSEVVELLNAGDLQNYSGSLTTPPCTEDVTWFVSTQKLQLTAETFGRVRDVIGFNSRFPQNELGGENLLALASSEVRPQVQLGADS